MKRNLSIICAVILIVSGFITVSCNNKEDAGANTAYKLSYGDSILYLQAVPGDYIVHPTETREGTFSGFPEGIEIDEITGAINITKSETGLRYRITHTAPNGKETTAIVVLSGITFTDHYYRLSTGDSIALPVYNAHPSRALPLSGSIFDERGAANGGGCDVKTNNGTINLAQTVRNGVFGSVPRNDERRDFDIEYRLNDASGKALNKLRVRLYWYNTIADVPADILQILNERETQGVFLRTTQVNNNTPQLQARTGAIAKPRPPCVIIVAN